MYEGILLSHSNPIQQMEEIKRFEFFEDDLIVASYIKAGEKYLKYIVVCNAGKCLDVLRGGMFVTEILKYFKVNCSICEHKLKAFKIRSGCFFFIVV